MQSTKDKVLQVLLAHQGEYISGEQIGKMLFLSRNAVWKSIKTLKADGYSINAVSNKGYYLSQDEDILSAEGINNYLIFSDFFDLNIHTSLASTNDTLKQAASHGAMEGKVVIASEQTKGKGRFGRTFYSPNNTGIYFSLLLQPTLSNNEISMLTSMAAVAVCRAINKATGKKAQIKWVNDIFLADKKICGILSEATFTLENGQIENIILGFGLNIYTPNEGFPDELTNIAGTLLAEKTQDIRNKLIAYILNEVLALYKNFNTNEIAKEYKKLSCILGRKIQVIKNNSCETATALDINKQNHLVVEYEDKRIEALSTGEISIKL